MNLEERIQEHERWLAEYPNENQGRRNALLNDLIAERAKTVFIGDIIVFNVNVIGVHTARMRVSKIEKHEDGSKIILLDAMLPDWRDDQ